MRRPRPLTPLTWILLLPGIALGDEAAAPVVATPDAAAAPAEAQSTEPPPWYRRIAVHGFADVYYGFNFNRPADNVNFVPYVGTSGKRDNEFSLNLGVVEINLDPEPLGARVVLNYGTGTEVLHSAELTGDAVGPQVWRFVQEASLSYKAPVGNGLTFTGGIYPSHIGLEVLASKDNWNYTRSWVSDLAPFYQTGVRVSYPFTKNLSAQLHLMNGWNLVADNNAAKSLGAQLMWNSERLQAVANGLFGAELPGDDSHWRYLGDFFVVVTAARWFQFAAVADVGYQMLPLTPDGRDGALWWAAEGYLRAVPARQFALALRGGYFSDPEGAISGAKQSLIELTATAEIRPYEGFSIKVEGRHDRSTADVFSTGDRDAQGLVLKTGTQTLVMVGGVAAF